MVATTVSLPDFWAGFIVGILFCAGVFVLAVYLSFRQTRKRADEAAENFEQTLREVAGKHLDRHST